MKVCISCPEVSIEGKKAIRVKEDRVIRIIRKVKQAFRIARNNELYVCEEHLEEHKKRRRSFEKHILFASVLAGIVVLIVVAMLVLSGRFEPWPFISAFIIGAFILLLPLLKYTPALEGDVPVMIYAKKVPSPSKQKRKRKK